MQTRREALKMLAGAAALAGGSLVGADVSSAEQKHYVYEFPLDPVATGALVRLRTEWVEAGLIIAPPAAERPHVTVLSCSAILPEQERIGAYLARTDPFPIEFSAVASFAGARPVVYLGVEPFPVLRSLQAELFAIATVHGVEVAEFSHPAKTVFHATLGYAASEANAAAAVERFRAQSHPHPSRATRLELVEYPGARILAAFPLRVG